MSKVRPIDLSIVIASITSIFRPLAQQKQLDFSAVVVMEDPLIMGDRQAIQNLLECLITHAIQTMPQGTIRVKIASYDSAYWSIILTASQMHRAVVDPSKDINLLLAQTLVNCIMQGKMTIKAQEDQSVTITAILPIL